MTWYAHNLYMPATERAVQTLLADDRLSPFLHVVRSLAGFSWHNEAVKHDVGSHGLAVVRPIAPAQGYCTQWYASGDGSVLPWETLVPVGANVPSPHRPHRAATEDDDEYVPVEEEQTPPPAMLQFLRTLSGATGETVLYYSAFMWGGDIEFETAWVFTPAQYTYITQVPVESTQEAKPAVRILREGGDSTLTRGDTLIMALRHVGVSLPTPFFALHTRRFPWPRHHAT